MKSVAIVQSCYIPWRGYFDIIALVDEFIFFDDRQFTRRDWRNRNRIKTPQGSRWLTVPVQVKGKYLQRIDETLIDDPAWGRSHLQTLRHSYSRAPFLDDYLPLLADLYATEERFLSKVNRAFVEAICRELGIATRLTWSTDYEAVGTKTERLVSLCLAAGATRYLSGPSARAYLDESEFAAAGIVVDYVDYSGYAEYPQLHEPFDPAVTILDLLFHVGRDAPAYMKHVQRARDVV